MIRDIGFEDIDLVVDLVYELNNIREHSSEFCYSEKDAIRKEVMESIEGKNHISLGDFDEIGVLKGVILLYMESDNKNADCIGIFVDKKYDYMKTGDSLLRHARRLLPSDFKITFFFPCENTEYKKLLESNSAVRDLNNYNLKITIDDYMESMNKMELVNLEKEHYEDLIRIHDQIFPEIYISGREIVEKIGVNRDVFVLSEETELDAYCVLRYWENSDNITVEILGVDEEKRGKGYGRKLLSNVLDYIFSERFKSANLIVDADNEKAISLYTSLGFKIQKIDLHYTL